MFAGLRNAWKTARGNVILQEVQSVMATVLQMTVNDRAEFVLTVAQGVEGFSAQYGDFNSIPESKAKAYSGELYRQARSLQKINIGKSAGLHFIGLALEAVITPGDDASMAAAMCDGIIGDVMEDTAMLHTSD